MGLSKPKSVYDIVQRPVIIDPPMGAKPILRTGAIGLPGIGKAGVIVEYTVPTNNSAVIWRIGNGSALETTSGFVTGGDASIIWQVLKNGSPFEGMDEILIIIGLTEQLGGQLPAPLWAPQNTLIQLVIQNISQIPNNNAAVGLLAGWRYPSRLDPPALR